MPTTGNTTGSSFNIIDGRVHEWSNEQWVPLEMGPECSIADLNARSAELRLLLDGRLRWIHSGGTVYFEIG